MATLGANEIGPDDLLLDGFVGFLRRERGLSVRTIKSYATDMSRFLAGRGRGEVSELSATDVSKAVLSEAARVSPASVRRYGCALRSLLRYCYLVGVVERDLSTAVLPVSGRRRSLLPKGITSAQSKALLGACDRRRASGRRDYAVILLMLRLGLRAEEVAVLCLDDLDWRAGEITVHGKGGRLDRLPLPVDVGEAIAGYLRRGRPGQATVREVFLGVQPPQVALTPTGLAAIVARAAGRAGIGVVRAHRLRHTAATDMLRAGASLAEIGQVLRHRSPASTAIYARVDVERLRSIARPWPTEAAS
jgi:integrase/recombinase XerD